ncbi:MAG: hemolysin III family protein [Solirubrobacterales bacterium]
MAEFELPDPKLILKPRFRGVSHKVAFFVALVAGTGLVAAAPAGSRLPIAIYSLSLVAMFGASALYHRGKWNEKQLPWFRRLDHSMIFVLIAGTYTPFATLVLNGTIADVILAVVWGGALAGIIVTMFWVDAPTWITAIIYVVLGWISVIMLPALVDSSGWGAVVLLGAGGVLYTLGAVVYATHRPDPVPHVFGYHEVFHVFVIAAAAVQFIAVAIYAIN